MDEDSGDTALVLALQNWGVDVITTLGVNRLSFSDEEQLIWARSRFVAFCIVLTFGISIVYTQFF
jgi:hypothetical protein